MKHESEEIAKRKAIAAKLVKPITVLPAIPDKERYQVDFVDHLLCPSLIKTMKLFLKDSLALTKVLIKCSAITFSPQFKANQKAQPNVEGKVEDRSQSTIKKVFDSCNRVFLLQNQPEFKAAANEKKYPLVRLERTIRGVLSKNNKARILVRVDNGALALNLVVF
uniref:40S ribosomal protein S7 n=1 Tax=Rhabditophanes sp. KR3021 TaxID=114890 RepID=A0AC35U0P7_9BILA